MNNIIRTFLFKRQKKRIDFIVCGAQKCGTSALDTYLREHPEICLAKTKEVHFFDREPFFKTGNGDYSKYHEHFAPELANLIVGEVTPSYLYWHEAPKRMWDYNPDLKLIVLLRNPIERAFSHWNMERIRNNETLPFGEAIRQENERRRQALPYQHKIFSYVDRGYYLEQLRRLWMFFPKNNILILRSNDLEKNTHDTIKLVCQFLGVNSIDLVNVRKINSNRYNTSLDYKDKEYLLKAYEYDIKALERALGWDCSDWLSV